jgi:hypothetical protein
MGDRWVAKWTSDLLLRVLERAAAEPVPQDRRAQLVRLLRDEVAQRRLECERLRAHGSTQLAEHLDRLVRVLPTLESALADQLVAILQAALRGDERRE